MQAPCLATYTYTLEQVVLNNCQLSHKRQALQVLQYSEDSLSYAKVAS